ncbi:single-stranded-DNA-specific exonuclease RecJ [Microgenomates group bacterium RBG_16_45_19]|nr:MAG: single-stranded-DNA-specific exonuclease RecJ [Microgenomates group bacterium RBG_16_45_19]
MHWTINHTLKSTTAAARRQEIMSELFTRLGLKSKSAITHYLKPASPLTLNAAAAGLNQSHLHQAVRLIKSAIKHQSLVIIYGDYDADGVCATAILWESLHALGAQAYPFIPSRKRHGYGLSVKGIRDALSLYQSSIINHKPLIITVDNGITAHTAAKSLANQGIPLIITDHHQPGKTLPPHQALVHTDRLSGAGIAWFLVKALVQTDPGSLLSQTLDLVTIGTVADMMPLVGVNRSLVKSGLIAISQTTRPGLKALLQTAGLEPGSQLSTYHLNFMIAPRLNAAGRLENAMDSLRLLCTHHQARAQQLATQLNQTNLTRQDLTQTLVDQAVSSVTPEPGPLIFIAADSFHEGVIGLVAGKLTETFYRPAIVVSRHQEISKASARSIKGVNIIELIRTHEAMLLNAGGHPMAAGFTIQTASIQSFKEAIIATAAQTIDPALFDPNLDIDCLIELKDITQALFQDLQSLKPFGLGNREPVFALRGVQPFSRRLVGKTGNHLKLTFKLPGGQILSAIGFGFGSNSHPGGGEKRQRLVSPGVKSIAPLDLAFTLQENTFNGRTSLQLLLKDIQHS